MVQIVLLCFAGALQGILVNGLINVVISSIEKRSSIIIFAIQLMICDHICLHSLPYIRFRIKSSDSGFIANSYDIASFLCLLPGGTHHHHHVVGHRDSFEAALGVPHGVSHYKCLKGLMCLEILSHLVLNWQ